jgi:hypothetical protein
MGFICLRLTWLDEFWDVAVEEVDLDCNGVDGKVVEILDEALDTREDEEGADCERTLHVEDEYLTSRKHPVHPPLGNR